LMAACVACEPKSGLLSAAFAITYIFPWVALAMMTVGWVQNRRIHKVWPISGALIGLSAIALSLGFGLMVAPLACLLAVYLTWFHLRPSSKTEQAKMLPGESVRGE
jgi:ABC-type sulfate transport system permease component